ncbi:hypothetical protein Tco_0164023 [Tanacetum coccineum]
MPSFFNNTSIGKGEVPQLVFQAVRMVLKYQIRRTSHQIEKIYRRSWTAKWNLALLSMRADRFWKKTGEESAPNAMMAIGWDWIYMANEDENHALVAEDVSNRFGSIRGLERDVEMKDHKIDLSKNELGVPQNGVILLESAEHQEVKTRGKKTAIGVWSSKVKNLAPNNDGHWRDWTTWLMKMKTMSTCGRLM